MRKKIKVVSCVDVPCSALVLIQHCAARVPDKADFRFLYLVFYFFNKPVFVPYGYPLRSNRLILKLPVVRQLCVLSSYGTGTFCPGLWIRIHFFRIRIRIQSMMLETNTDPDPDPIRIQGFNDQKLKKNYS
jgi:hypothetical protein